MKTKKTDRKRILSVAPITSRGVIGDTGRNLTLRRALNKRLRTVEKYAQEADQLRAAIKALGGKP